MLKYRSVNAVMEYSPMSFASHATIPLTNLVVLQRVSELSSLSGCFLSPEYAESNRVRKNDWLYRTDASGFIYRLGSDS